ncbi:hydroxyacid dehydrogenase [Psychrobacillus sp. AK 1817]|uniref:four-carbon acid sugar kinase family protein n=1 Tax=Psychrobacillus sp. AK 1817 TaxID=2303505 RepID=UPI001243FE7F|nr:four-carbon acid sugar kinase family protein [Psychrobacillus sp. AK 1817]QEY22363.1 hydroxyacid dehydrogenase [Psychrobacillus sp. AK 1817]QGM29250.1 hydroxyacid dehydrogenase [Bacillus sp. N3536]
MINSKEARNTQEVLASIPSVDTKLVQQMLKDELRNLNKKIIVLDDDPTGVQTVHGISVYTDWSIESIEMGFKEDNTMFFLLTNSRGFTAAETEQAHIEIAENIVKVANKVKKDFIVISRGDSTLRGHYPLETEVLKNTVEQNSNVQYDGEVILPFFKEGGRFTIDNIHYVQYDEQLVPAGETEFAKDRTFGYKKSHLGEWVEEKTEGKYTAEKTTYISLTSLRELNVEGITNQLLQVKNFDKVVVNAVDYVDVEIFVIALVKAMKAGKQFMFRSAAALTKVIGGVSDKSLLTREELIKEETNHGGLILVGSHVKKTTEQLEVLKTNESIEFIEFDCHLVLEANKFQQEIDRVIETTESLIKEGKTVTVYTRRERLDLGEGKKEEELKLSVQISDAVTSIVQRLSIRPNFIIAKGGITSSDIGTRGLEVKRATVAGQIKPGIPVWLTGEESKFPGIAYVIFPGNVGAVTTLKETVDMLNR